MALNIAELTELNERAGLCLSMRNGSFLTHDGSSSQLVIELLRLAYLGQAFERFAANIPNTRVSDAYDDAVNKQGAPAALGRGRVERF